MFKNPYNKRKEDSNDISETDSYFDYSSKHTDELIFRTYDKAKLFFNENYEDLLNIFPHWIDKDEDGNLKYVELDRGENFNMQMSISFEEMRM